MCSTIAAALSTRSPAQTQIRPSVPATGSGAAGTGCPRQREKRRARRSPQPGRGGGDPGEWSVEKRCKRQRRDTQPLGEVPRSAVLIEGPISWPISARGFRQARPQSADRQPHARLQPVASPRATSGRRRGDVHAAAAPCMPSRLAVQLLQGLAEATAGGMGPAPLERPLPRRRTQHHLQ